ncbi:hypothetical protein CcaCcLH18_11436 [Colletotrichum camelliae]|nr:hypothetical protein CcaCcLH18_11436 [Colletotrichum camelliae]
MSTGNQSGKSRLSNDEASEAIKTMTANITTNSISIGPVGPLTIFTSEMLEDLSQHANVVVSESRRQLSRTALYGEIRNAVVDQLTPVHESKLWALAIRALALPDDGRLINTFKAYDELNATLKAMYKVVWLLSDARTSRRITEQDVNEVYKVQLPEVFYTGEWAKLTNLESKASQTTVASMPGSQPQPFTEKDMQAMEQRVDDTLEKVSGEISLSATVKLLGRLMMKNLSVDISETFDSCIEKMVDEEVEKYVNTEALQDDATSSTAETAVTIEWDSEQFQTDPQIVGSPDFNQFQATSSVAKSRGRTGSNGSSSSEKRQRQN